VEEGAREIRIGREVDNDIRVGAEHAQVSRYQAVVRVASNGDLSIEDLGTANGTHVNDVQLTQAQSLQVGDRVCFGSFVFDLHQIEKFLGSPLPNRNGEVPGGMEPTAETGPSSLWTSTWVLAGIWFLFGCLVGYMLATLIPGAV
jgi:pSer/pThr/pTyr-binding forkhead associated (FHA) protein